MEITDVRITLHSGGKLRAFAAIILDDSIAIHGIKVIEGTLRTFVAMPARVDGNRQTDVCHPIDQKTRVWLEKVVLSAYDAELHKGNGHPSWESGAEESDSF